MALALVLFWVATGLLAWVYFVYPLVARFSGAVRPVRLVDEGGAPALVTVGLAVHDAGAELEERLTDIIEQETPFEIEIVVASDGSSDQTVATLQRMAAGEPRLRVLDLPWRGQSAAQSAIFGAARGEVVVLTDAETRFGPSCLTALVRPLSDPRVGCSTGILRWRFDSATDTAQHEGVYWRYEQAVRAWESRAGWLSAATGALLAARRSIYRAVPPHASLDQMLPLYCRADGSLVMVAADAVGSDRGAASVAEQYESRVRIATQGIEANLRMSTHILPWRMPGSFMAIWSHKILRWATPILAAVAVTSAVSVAVLSASPLYLLPGAATIGVVALAVLGYAAGRAGRSVPITGLALTIVTVNLAFARAWLNVLTRQRIRAWASPG